MMAEEKCVRYRGEMESVLKAKDIILRDFRESDIEKRLYWETVENEWQHWDSPWEFEGLTGSEKETHLQELLRTLHDWALHPAPASVRRGRFQIALCEEETKCIGWVASYYITENYIFTTSKTDRCAVGIDIPDQSVRGKGYAYQALCFFIDYLLEHGESEVYTQTWSGNTRMVHIAEQMGFVECGRKKDLRMVRGKKYDWVTFQLDRKKYAAFKKEKIVW